MSNIPSKVRNSANAQYRGFRKAAQSLVHPWALILGGPLYGAKISVEYDLYLFPYTVRPTLYRVWKLFGDTQAICNCRITARAVIWFTSYFPNLSIFLLTALSGLPENLNTSKEISFSRTCNISNLILYIHGIALSPLETLHCLCVHQGSPTFVKLRATSWVAISAKGY